MPLKQPRSLCFYTPHRPQRDYAAIFRRALSATRIEAASLVRELPGWSLVQRVRARMAESEIDRLYVNRKVAVWNRDIAEGLLQQYRKEVAGIDYAIREHNAAVAKARLNVRGDK